MYVETIHFILELFCFTLRRPSASLIVLLSRSLLSVRFLLSLSAFQKTNLGHSSTLLHFHNFHLHYNTTSTHTHLIQGSAQVRALVHLGANACIIGRNPEKTTRVAADIATARSGAKVIGIGEVDVRKLADLERAAKRCVEELGSLDYCM